MALVHKTVLLGFSAAQMYALVDGVEDYPKFLPWCGGGDVLSREADKLVAKVHINYHGIKQHFTTKNERVPDRLMKMTLVEGPFKQLDGTWKFTPLREDACRIDFDLHYEFSSKLLEKIIGRVFDSIANSFVDSFCKRAEDVYGI